MKSIVEISVDLVTSAKNSRGPLRIIDARSLEVIERRYRMFLTLKRDSPHIPFAPTGDIDEMWHLHMLHPVNYVDDCNRIFGFILDHNPGFGGASAEEYKQLVCEFDHVKRLWESTFSEPYVYEGAVKIDSVVMCDDKETGTLDKDKSAALSQLGINSVVMCDDKETETPNKDKSATLSQLGINSVVMCDDKEAGTPDEDKSATLSQLRINSVVMCDDKETGTPDKNKSAALSQFALEPFFHRKIKTSLSHSQRSKLM